MVSLPDTLAAHEHSNSMPRPQGREGKEWYSSQSENPNFPVAPPETTSSVFSSNQAAKSEHSAHNWRTWRSTWQLSRPWEAAQKHTSWCSQWANGFRGPGQAKAKNHSSSYQGKLGSVTLSKERKLIRPLSTWQNLREMPSNLFSTVSSSSLEGGLSLRQIQQQKRLWPEILIGRLYEINWKLLNPNSYIVILFVSSYIVHLELLWEFFCSAIYGFTHLIATYCCLESDL